jgi:glutamine amidotransferase
MGNLHSISKALQFACPEHNVHIVSNAEQILKADRVVFPGVGAIRDCMSALKKTGLDEVLIEASRNKPFLGICLGMQALLEQSEENDDTDCLGLFSGQVVHFPKNLKDKNDHLLKIPHMGWNQVQQQHSHPLWKSIPQNSGFYFVHSYYAQLDQERAVAAISDYAKPFVCALSRENIFAVQFHPEKSQAMGLQLLKNFMNWDGDT